MQHLAALVYDTAELGEHARRARRAKGFLQEELAERIGVNRMTISRLEHGEPVGIDTALRALSECGVTLAVVPKFSRLAVHDGA
jgi:HTH-type transcriptional regulator/antitoxin HipB